MLLPSRITLLVGRVALLPSQVTLVPDSLDGLLKGFMLLLDPGELLGISVSPLDGDSELILRLTRARLRLPLLQAQVGHHLTEGGGSLLGSSELPGQLPVPPLLLGEAVPNPSSRVRGTRTSPGCNLGGPARRFVLDTRFGERRIESGKTTAKKETSHHT